LVIRGTLVAADGGHGHTAMAQLLPVAQVVAMRRGAVVGRFDRLQRAQQAVGTQVVRRIGGIKGLFA